MKPHVEALVERLRVCESETKQWEEVFEREQNRMHEALSGHNSHHNEIRQLKQAIALLLPKVE